MTRTTTGGGIVERQHADVVRTCLSVGFWLLAAGASAVLGLEMDGRP